MGRTRTSGGNKITVAERRRQACDMRRAGATYREIGEQLNVTESRAYNIVKAALDAVVVEGAAELRIVELERLDRMQRALWPSITRTVTTAAGVLPDPDLKAVDRVIRIMERRARLMGLDAPEAVEFSGPGGTPLLDAQVTARAVVDEMLARMAARLQPPEPAQLEPVVIDVETNGHGG